MSETRTVYSGPGLFTMTFIVFLVLKLTDVIDWSWWWVTAPLWIPVLIFLAILSVIGVLWFIGCVLERKEQRLRDQLRRMRHLGPTQNRSRQGPSRS